MRTRRGIAFASLLATLALTAPAHAGPSQVPGLQVALRSHGLYAGPIDAIPGPMTKRAVRLFQRRKGLAVDGIAGPRTRHAFGRLGRPLYGKRLITHGMTGWDVSVLQFQLRRRGVRTGAVDGFFGPLTARAVVRFQGRARLAADGVVGPATRRAIANRRGTSRPLMPSLSRDEVRRRLIRISSRHGVSQRLVRSMAWIESGFQTNVVSSANAWGVMQVVPSTWRFVERVLLGRTVPRTVNGNIRVGVLYYRHLRRLFNGNRRLALAAYYQGPAAVRRHGVYPETRRYVRSVLSLYRSI